jgi:hypothetical protein
LAGTTGDGPTEDAGAPKPRECGAAPESTMVGLVGSYMRDAAGIDP